MLFSRAKDNGKQVETAKQSLTEAKKAHIRGDEDLATERYLDAIKAAEAAGRGADAIRCSALSSVSVLYTKREDFQSAQAALDAATQIIVSNQWQYARRHFWVMINTGFLRWRQGDRAAAQNVLQHAYEMLAPRAKTKSDHLALASILKNLCSCYIEARVIPEAERWMALASDHAKRQGKFSAEAWSDLFDLDIKLWALTGRTPTRLQSLKMGAADIERHFGADHSAMVSVRVKLASALLQSGQADEADSLFQKAQAQLLPEHGKSMTRLISNGLGMIALRRGQFSQAEELFRNELSAIDEPSGAPRAIVLNNIGVAIREQGRPAEAEPFLKQAVEHGEAAFGPNHFHPANATKNLGQVYQMMGRSDEAARLYETAIGRFEKASPAAGPVASKMEETRELLAKLRQQ